MLTLLSVFSVKYVPIESCHAHKNIFIFAFEGREGVLILFRSLCIARKF